MMTKQHWTTPEQRKWLEGQLTKFIEAQASDSTSSFYPEVYKGWQEKFGHPTPTAQDIEESNGNEEKAAIKVVKKTEKVLLLKTWI